MQQLASVNDSSGMVVALSFADEEGNAVTPTAATWTLTGGDGTIINSRQDVELTTASTVYITLGAADTAYADGAKRILVAEGEYLSSLTGGNVPVRAGCWFRITDLPE